MAIVILLVRPMTVAACTARSDLNLRERIFLGWVAPRGVVAASMASLFALTLANTSARGEAAFLESFVYSIIFVTVVLQGFSAGPLATLLKVRKIEPQGWLVVGAHNLGGRSRTFSGSARGAGCPD